MSLTLFEYPMVNPGPGPSVVNAGFNPMLWKFWRKDYQITKIDSVGGGDLLMIIITNNAAADSEIEVGDMLYVSDLILDTGNVIVLKAGIYEVLENVSGSLGAGDYGWKLKGTHNSAADQTLKSFSTGQDYTDWVCWMNVMKRNYKVQTKWRTIDIPSNAALGYYDKVLGDDIFSYSPRPDGYVEIDGSAVAKTMITPDFVVGANLYSDVLRPLMIGLGEPVNIGPYAKGVWDEGEEDAVGITDVAPADEDEIGYTYPIHSVVQGSNETNFHQYTMNLVQPAKFLTSFDIIPWYRGKPLPISYLFNPLDPPDDNTYAIGVRQYRIDDTQIDEQGAMLNGLGDSVDTLFLDQQFTLHDDTQWMQVFIGLRSGGVFTEIHSEVKRIELKPCTNNDLFLIWRNNLAGISAFVFSYNQDATFEVVENTKLTRRYTAYAENISPAEFEALQELNSVAFRNVDKQYAQAVYMQDGELYSRVINVLANNTYKTRFASRNFAIDIQVQNINMKLP
jgi:hypothetical protein